MTKPKAHHRQPKHQQAAGPARGARKDRAMIENKPMTEEFDTEAEEDARLLELADLADDECIPIWERAQARFEMLEILAERQPLMFNYHTDVPLHVRWTDAFVRTFEMMNTEVVSERRGYATLKKLLHELRFDVDDEVRASVGRLLEPAFKKLPLMRAALERRRAEAAGQRLN